MNTVAPHKKTFGVALLGLTLLLSACGPGSGGQSSEVGASQTTAAQSEGEAAAETRSAASQVRTRVPEQGVLYANRSVSVTLSPARQSTVASSASGRVDVILVQAGDTVKSGGVVLRLDAAAAQNSLNDAELAVSSAQLNIDKANNSRSGNIASQQQAVNAAQTAAQVAEQQYTQGQQLLMAGGIARLDVENLRSQLAQARSQLEQAKNQLSSTQRGADDALLGVQLQQAENRLINARKAVSDAQVRAPFTGTVTNVPVNEGEFLSAGSGAFTLADLSELEAIFRLPPDEADMLTSQSTLKLSYAGRTYEAKLSRNAALPGSDGLVALRARVISGGDLPAGANASLRYTLPLARGSLLPSAAVRNEAGQSVVFVMDGGSARAVTVRVLNESGGRMALSGLDDGQAIIYPLPPDLNDGDKVEVAS